MPVFDNFHDYSVGLTGPICGGFDITPDDSNDLAQVTRAFMVSGAGDVAVVLKNGTTLDLAGLTAGVLYPFRVSKVLATGTTATGIKGLV
ncbi:spike base protein, RCAP_Rcc01079 family [Roseobacter sp. GAI101]|uniref:spike base protein, RCAP_Rcc01079 family n=1 Tax=Roseobacter sp. (strain GAI101) TaxID=391589 RepID=UPI0001871FE0|nr:hypothetical protein [Roseobacter sp. GAI101]EEB83188.1 conserved hypothetical protein [Roseobacter sp. GAI101]